MQQSNLLHWGKPQNPDPSPTPQNRSMKYLIIALPLITLAACYTPPGQEWRTTAGLQTTVLDSYQAEIDAPGFSLTDGDVDYSMTEVLLGATRVTPSETRPVKHEFAGIVFGTGEADNVDLLEISAGGYYYIDRGHSLTPYLLVFATATDPDLSGFDRQFGFRLGGGVDFALTSQVSATLGADYLFPILDSENSSGNTELNLSGLALRLGFLFSL